MEIRQRVPLRLALRFALVAGILPILAAACGSSGPTPSPTPDVTPAGIVHTALDRMAAKDVPGLQALACAGQEDLIRQEIGLPASLGADLLPGVDTQSLLDAVKLDVGKVTVGDATVSGDTAAVPVGGDLGVTFDAVAMRPIVGKLLAAQGRTMTDAQLDALLQGLQAFGQAVPVDQSIRLVREDGAWKVCQDKVNLPSLKP